MPTTLLTGLLLTVGGAQAQGATTVGETFAPTQSLSGPRVIVQAYDPDNAYAAPFAGVVTSWSYQAAGGPIPPMKLKIVRSAGGNDYTTVGDSQLETPVPGVVNTWATRVPVQAGDLLGAFYSGTTLSHRNTTGIWGTAFRMPPDEDPPQGTTATYQSYPASVIDLAAQLEADADNDGFGDETQDECPGDATKQAECVPPDTSIQSGPSKTDKPKARFTFTSTEAGATFQCRLKGKGVKKALKRYAPCASPKRYKKLAPGKYRFLVFATDAAGNADLTPAKKKFKVLG
jgi:hypothetical protein